MKKIKIKFVDFWPSFNEEEYIFYKTLKKRYDVEISDNPDYVICSLFGSKHLKYNDKVKINVIGENIAPNFNLYDYAIGFYDIKFGDRYLKYNILFDEEMVEKAQNRRKNNGKKFCCFVYSKNKLNKKRKEIFDKISEYKKVDSGGRYLNNIEYSIGPTLKDKIDFQKQYKFVIACENQSYSEYNTEKLLEAFSSDAIPIYWGDPKIDMIYNNKSFINCMNYKSLDEVLKKVIELDNDNEKYNEMLEQNVFNEEYNFEREKEKFEKFIYNIIEQKYEDSKRVEFKKGFYVYEYYKKYYLVEKIYDLIVFLKLKIKNINHK